MYSINFGKQCGNVMYRVAFNDKEVLSLLSSFGHNFTDSGSLSLLCRCTQLVFIPSKYTKKSSTPDLSMCPHDKSKSDINNSAGNISASLTAEFSTLLAG